MPWISPALRCTALYIFLYDDDVLAYCLCRNRVQIDTYDSKPDYFRETPCASAMHSWETLRKRKRSPPAGGDAAKLCAALDAELVTREVETILRSEGYVFETKRHAALAQALGLPAFVMHNGYRNVAEGAILNGLDRSMLLNGELAEEWVWRADGSVSHTRFED